MNSQDLNRIKIKDLFAAIKLEFNMDTEVDLLKCNMLHNREERLLIDASDDDLKRAQEFFIEEKLGINYFPLENKKVINHTVVPIEQVYSEQI